MKHKKLAKTLNLRSLNYQMKKISISNNNNNNKFNYRQLLQKV